MSIHNDARVEASRRWALSDIGAPPASRLAWRAADVAETDWKLPIPSRCLTEVAEMVRTLRANPIPTEALTLDDVGMPACRGFMAGVKAVLEDGVGFAVLDRLPVEDFTKAELSTIYWLLSQMIARPVAQAFKGTLLYDVHDTGEKTSTRVRADKTSEDLSWHTDYGFNHPPPFIGLLVLRTALSGGESAAASLLTAHEIMRTRSPDLLRRLYQPYVWNRQGEHPDEAPICSSNPIFSAADGVVRARFNRALQPVGYRLLGSEIDAAGMDALNTVSDVMSEPANAVNFVLAPGQLQFLNNARIAHRRTAFEDHEAPDRRRHLVRIFLRDEGRRSYMG